MKRRFFFTILLMAWFSCHGYAEEIRINGQVIDENKLPIAHVNVKSENIAQNVQTDENGRFSVVLISSGSSRLNFSHAGYVPASVDIHPGDDNITIAMTTQVHPMQGITVTVGRAVPGQSPVSFQNISRETIDRDMDIGEVPELLELTPNLYSYSDAGGGLGYSYLSIRGFNARRAPVYINGVPLNDPEDHALYFIDLPDFASHLDNVQVQRGVGNSLYGDPSFGGSVNLLTSVLTHDRQAVLETGYGGFWQDGNNIGLMRKQSVFYSSGLLDNGWSLSGRWVKQFSDGYRENSWYDGTAYYLSLGRVDPRMITTVNIYGGPIKTHAAWDGIDRLTLSTNRRANWYTYSNETDNFNQPHFELHNIYNVSEKMTLNNTIYHIRGEGFYEQLKGGEDLYEYNLSETSGVLTSDLVRRKWVEKYQTGINSHVDYNDGKKQIVLGGSYYFFESEHWGEVIWAEELTPSIVNEKAPFKYYEYFGKYHNMSAYTSLNYALNDRVNLSGNIQLRYLYKNIHITPQGIFDPTMYALDWLFLSPRVGINYSHNDKLSSYFSFSVASHEPNDDMIDDADDPFDAPRLDIIDDSIIPVVYGNATVGSERIYDFELGVNYRISELTLDGNLFWMEYRNALVPDGGLTDDGFPTYGNAERSLHRGIELAGAYKIRDNLQVEGNIALNDFWIKEYDQHNWDGTITQHQDVATPNFPKYITNLAFDYSIGAFEFVYRIRAVGRQFISLDGRYTDVEGESVDISIAPSTISSLKAIMNLGTLLNATNFQIEGRVNNLFNEKYETFGYRWGDYFAYWPAAERNWFVNLKMTI
ncbi:MAG: TonB-dependent receptor [candidate division Zixibacteria bacterium]